DRFASGDVEGERRVAQRLEADVLQEPDAFFAVGLATCCANHFSWTLAVAGRHHHDVAEVAAGSDVTDEDVAAEGVAEEGALLQYRLGAQQQDVALHLGGATL